MTHVESPEFHITAIERTGASLEAEVEWIRRVLPHAQARILDIGCGRGDLAAALQRAGLRVEGVELTAALAAEARSKGVRVHEQDAVEFMEQQGSAYEVVLMLDFVEHVTFSAVARILAALRSEALCVIQTPNTNSLQGHAFYLMVPSHVTPFSASLLSEMFERTGMEVVQLATFYGGIPWTGLRRRLTEWLLVKLLGTTTTRLLSEGGNLRVVARKLNSRQI